MKLERCDDEVHHDLDATGRNMILNRATYKRTIITIIITITITIISPLTDETDVLLHTRLSTHASPRCLALSCLSILWCCRSNYYVVALTYQCNRRCPPYLIVCIGYNAESHGQTISDSITCQWHGGVPRDPQDSRSCTTRTHLSCVPIRQAKQLHRDFHLNVWIRFSTYLPPVFMPRTNIAFVGSTRDLNSLNLTGKPMLLINTQLSFTFTAVAVAIVMQISALLVPSLVLDPVAKRCWRSFSLEISQWVPRHEKSPRCLLGTPPRMASWPNQIWPLPSIMNTLFCLLFRVYASVIPLIQLMLVRWIHF